MHILEMNPTMTTSMNADDTCLSSWTDNLVVEASSTPCLTVGVCNGGREANDRLTMDHLLGRLERSLTRFAPDRRMLSIRIDPQNMQADKPIVERMPIAQRSALGDYHEVQLSCERGSKNGHALNGLADWLPSWKEAFGLIVLDIGPIDSREARVSGRLCDGCYVLLGPRTCGSQEWINQQIAWHSRSGSTVCGTILAQHAEAA
ncbi:MAG: hypothetical protein AB8B50_16180 [Pirellulaceae bacterium]